MQLTLLASLAVLCSAAFATPPARRGDSLAEIIAYVEDDLNDVTVDVLKRDDALIQVIADVEDDLNNLTVNVLAGRRDVDLVDVEVYVENVLNDADIEVLK